MDDLTDALLDALRLHGDPVADGVIAVLFKEGASIATLNGLLSTVNLNDQSPPAELPPVLREYFEGTAQLPAWTDEALLRCGEEYFQRHGAQIMMLLGCYSLPADYAARKGVQVLYRTREMLLRPARRVVQTAQLIIDVMSPGGLGPGGTGVRSIQKARLIHAAVRHCLLEQGREPWPAELGRPINQEDMAGTLMSFSFAILDGMERMGAPAEGAAAEGYLHAWRVAGALMGIDQQLLPRTLAEAARLANLIRQRQFGPSAEGIALTAALLKMMDDFARPLHGMAATMMRFFLGDQLADDMGIPAANWTERIFQLGIHLNLDDEILANRVELAAFTMRLLSKAYFYSVRMLDGGGGRPQLLIPEVLERAWGGG